MVIKCLSQGRSALPTHESKQVVLRVKVHTHTHTAQTALFLVAWGELPSPDFGRINLNNERGADR